MNRFVTIAALFAGWCLYGSTVSRKVAGGDPPSLPNRPAAHLSHWPTERVELVGGRDLHGLIESENDAWVRLIEIHRPAGRPMYLVIRSIDRLSVAEMVRLPSQQRAELQQRIDQFRNRSRIEEIRWQAVRLKPIVRAGNHYQQYRGKWFTLESTAGEEMTRRVIVRIEQVFTAYRQILPPRSQPQRALRLAALGSMEQYRTYLKRLGIDIRNPACFIQEDNLVVAGSELNRLGAQLDEINARHERLREELTRLEKETSDRLAALGRQLKEEGVSRNDARRLLRLEKAKFQRLAEEKRQELDSCDRENARLFDGLTHQMFARLYHEAFHAYLENYVFPHDRHHVPRWLNEGLAVMFEEGLLESGTLRVDAPNREALGRLQADLGSDQPLSLNELLAADQGEFLFDHGADRFYDYSWGLAYYLTFEKGLLAGAALQQYVEFASEDTPPVERFEKLSGMPLAEFELIWREFIANLR